MPDVVTAVLYYRVSTEEQSKKGFSLPEQRRECTTKAHQLATALGATIRMFEFEDAASGEVLDRPGLTACRDFLKSNQVRYFICLDPDRFSRSLFLQLLVTQEIEGRGMDLVFVQHNYERTPEGRLFYQMRGAISEFEKAKIRERSARGRKGKLAQGGIPNHIPVWGYEWDTKLKTLRPDSAAAPWVLQMFTWYAEGWSYQRIAEEFMRLGVPPKRAKFWHKTSIARMLKNPVYAGRLVLNKWDCVGNATLKQIPKDRRTKSVTDRTKPTEEWVTVPVEPLISEDLWSKAQTQHGNRTRLMQRGVSLLSGLCICGLCGGKVHYVGDPKYRYLRCRNRYPHLLDPTSRPEQACEWRDIASGQIERVIWQRVLNWLQDPDSLRQERERQAESRSQVPERNEEQVQTLKAVLETKREEHRRMFYLAAKGLAPAGVEAELERLQMQVKALEAELDKVISSAAVVQDETTTLFRNLELMRQELLERLDSLDLQGRQKVVRFLVREVQVWPDGRFEHVLK